MFPDVIIAVIIYARFDFASLRAGASIEERALKICAERNASIDKKNLSDANSRYTKLKFANDWDIYSRFADAQQHSSFMLQLH